VQNRQWPFSRRVFRRAIRPHNRQAKTHSTDPPQCLEMGVPGGEQAPTATRVSSYNHYLFPLLAYSQAKTVGGPQVSIRKRNRFGFARKHLNSTRMGSSWFSTGRRKKKKKGSSRPRPTGLTWAVSLLPDYFSIPEEEKKFKASRNLYLRSSVGRFVYATDEILKTCAVCTACEPKAGLPSKRFGGLRKAAPTQPVCRVPLRFLFACYGHQLMGGTQIAPSSDGWNFGPIWGLGLRICYSPFLRCRRAEILSWQKEGIRNVKISPTKFVVITGARQRWLAKARLAFSQGMARKSAPRSEAAKDRIDALVRDINAKGGQRLLGFQD